MKKEIDLHGYQVVEGIAIFVDFYNRQVKSGDLSAVSVIHGYGKTGEGGRIRSALRKLLEYHEESLSFDTDSVNPGITRVFPRATLPSGAGIVACEIIEYCLIPRSESKILCKFRNHGDLGVKNTLRSLVKQGRLIACVKGRHCLYTAI
jgi:hypothetical protein